MQHKNYQTFSGIGATAADIFTNAIDRDFYITFANITANPNDTTIPFIVQLTEGGFSAPDRRPKLFGTQVTNNTSVIHFDSSMTPIRIEKGQKVSITFQDTPPSTFSSIANFQYTISGYWE